MASRFEVLFLVGVMTVVSALAAVAADLFAFPAILAAAWSRGGLEPVALRRPPSGQGGTSPSVSLTE